MRFDIHTLIGEATAYDKKQQIPQFGITSSI